MKLPTSVTTKPSSGFHICDILELNKDKSKDEKKPQDDENVIRRADEEIDENCDEYDDVDVQKENLSSESEENLLNESDPQHAEKALMMMKRKHSPSPTSQQNDTESHSDGDEQESSQDSHRADRNNKLINNNNNNNSSNKMKHMKHSKRSENEEIPSFNGLGHAATAANHHQQLLSDTLHQYSSHLFQNHPAMRPWFNPNGKFNYILIRC